MRRPLFLLAHLEGLEPPTPGFEVQHSIQLSYRYKIHTTYYNIKSINKYLDLILIGEKWESTPKKGENFIFIKEGMKFLINTNNYGLRSIMDFYNMIVINDESIDKIIDVITPTINVVTMTDNARIIIELLITNRKERAEQITKYLNKSKENV